MAEKNSQAPLATRTTHFEHNLTGFEHFLVVQLADLYILIKHKIMSNKKVWFITGASKGLGLALTRLA